MTFSPCGEAVRTGDQDRFRAALFAKPQPREHLFALYAFNLEIAKIAPMVSEPMLGEIRLQWWREALDQIYGEAPVRRHEVVTPLSVAIRETGLPRAPFDALIDQRANDLDRTFPVHENGGDLHSYIRATAGGLTALAVQILVPAATPEGLTVARDAGFGIGVSRYLMALPRLVKAGRKPVPMDVLEGLAEEGRGCIARARANRKALPKAASPALLELANAWHNLHSVTARSEYRKNLSLLWHGFTGRW